METNNIQQEISSWIEFRQELRTEKHDSGKKKVSEEAYEGVFEKTEMIELSSEKILFSERSRAPVLSHYGAISNPEIVVPEYAERPKMPKKNKSTNSLHIALSYLEAPLEVTGDIDEDIPPISEPVPRDYNSLFVVYFLTLVAEGARGLVIHTIWPFLLSLGGKKSTLGFLIASYSFGRVLSTIPLGALTDRLPTSHVLIGASILQMVGHLVYASAHSVPFLFVGRVFVGFGSATSAVARAHIARAIPRKERTRHYAYLCCTQFVGLAGLPALGGLLDMIPQFNFYLLPFNGFTYPAIVLSLANMLCIWLISNYYKCPTSEDQQKDDIPQQIDEPPASMIPRSSSEYSFDVLALSFILVFNVVFRGVLSQLETVTVPFLLERFSVSRSTASISLSSISILGVLVFFNIDFLTEKYSTRRLVGIGLLTLTASAIPLSITYLESRVSILVYILFLCFPWSVAYPVGYTAVLSLFSKRLGDLPVGSLMGIFSAAGACAPLLFAPIAGGLWETQGRSSVFLFISIVSALACILFIYSFHRFKPRDAVSN